MLISLENTAIKWGPYKDSPSVVYVRTQQENQYGLNSLMSRLHTALRTVKLTPAGKYTLYIDIPCNLTVKLPSKLVKWCGENNIAIMTGKNPVWHPDFATTARVPWYR